MPTTSPRIDSDPRPAPERSLLTMARSRSAAPATSEMLRAGAGAGAGWEAGCEEGWEDGWEDGWEGDEEEGGGEDEGWVQLVITPAIKLHSAADAVLLDRRERGRDRMAMDARRLIMKKVSSWAPLGLINPSPT